MPAPPPRQRKELPIFRSLRVLKALNVAAVGLSLSASTSAILFGLFSDYSPRFAFAVAAPTLVLGVFWAALLRSPKKIEHTSLRRGWVASVPLAILNAMIATCLVHGNLRSLASLIGTALMGATFGAVVWVPALCLTLACFGLPIAIAQSLARKGLAGEERGEWLVGLASVLIAGASFRQASGYVGDGVVVPLALAVLGMASGGLATLLAVVRELRRRRFVARAEAGRIPGYRVDVTDKGRVLLRIATRGEGYRIADVEEELATLDADGIVTLPGRRCFEGAP